MSKLIIINKTTLSDADAVRVASSFLSMMRTRDCTEYIATIEGLTVSAKRNLRSMTVNVEEVVPNV